MHDEKIFCVCQFFNINCFAILCSSLNDLGQCDFCGYKSDNLSVSRRGSVMPFLWPPAPAPAPASQKMGGSSGMEKLLEAQQQQLDDITSESSFLEFLRNEQSCLGAVISGDCAGSNGRNGSSEDVDVDRIFAQVSKLAGGVEEDRSVDDILMEAEQLIRKQPIFRELDKNSVASCEANQNSVQKVTSGLRDISCESTPMEMKCGVLEELEGIARREEDSKELLKVRMFNFRRDWVLRNTDVVHSLIVC